MIGFKVDLITADSEVMEEAIRSLGYLPLKSERGVSFLMPGCGEIHSQEAGTFAPRLQYAYALQAIKNEARRLKWTIKEVSTTHLELTRKTNQFVIELRDDGHILVPPASLANTGQLIHNITKSLIRETGGEL